MVWVELRCVAGMQMVCVDGRKVIEFVGYLGTRGGDVHRADEWE